MSVVVESTPVENVSSNDTKINEVVEKMHKTYLKGIKTVKIPMKSSKLDKKEKLFYTLTLSWLLTKGEWDSKIAAEKLRLF